MLGGISKKQTIIRNRSPKTKLLGGQDDVVRGDEEESTRRRPRRNSQREKTSRVWCPGNQVRKGFQGFQMLLTGQLRKNYKGLCKK